MNWILLGVLVVANVPLYLLLGHTFFGGWDGFLEALRFWLTPDVWSLFKGEYWEDWSAEMRLFIFVVVCVAAVAAEYALLVKIFR